MDNQQYANQCFDNGMNCSQAVVSKFWERWAGSGQDGLRASAGFGGGMKQASHCGAVTGAYMVLGLYAGQQSEDIHEVKRIAGELVGDFTSRFQQLCGSVICRDLLGHDISTPEGLAKARQEDQFKKVCRPLVGDALDVLDQMLQDQPRFPGPSSE